MSPSSLIHIYGLSLSDLNPSCKLKKPIMLVREFLIVAANGSIMSMILCPRRCSDNISSSALNCCSSDIDSIILFNVFLKEGSWLRRLLTKRWINWAGIFSKSLNSWFLSFFHGFNSFHTWPHFMVHFKENHSKTVDIRFIIIICGILNFWCYV